MAEFSMTTGRDKEGIDSENDLAETAVEENEFANEDNLVNFPAVL